MNEVLSFFFHNRWVFLQLLITLGVFLAVHSVLFLTVRRIAMNTNTNLDNSFVKRFRAPSRWIFLWLAVRFSFPFFEIPVKLHHTGLQFLSVLLIILIAWLLIRIVRFLEDLIIQSFDIKATDNLEARKIHTQVRVLKRVLIGITIIVAFASCLMVFEHVRQLGTTVLASAGIIGIIVGMAAQKTIGTFIAGIQIAFFQPIRIDDVVIVEGEWGRIEEITLTYVVVRIWDQRRLIVPINFFMESSFQNWTRVSADILGTIYLYLDYTVPIREIREHLREIVESHEKWDGKVCGLQVTNTTDKSVELRCLVSASDASKAWDLRCDVREKMIEYIQAQYPLALPHMRAEVKQQNLDRK